ncbi:hypothetical protein [Spirillospora sp. CA-294931]|uniref:hypothetical protein n=1 Tax=Spirillospora sp. CA-294931 TaxID=3240042 RepID=UPI003D8E3A01
MDRRLIVGIALASVAAFSAAGCGSDSKEAKEAPEVVWAGKACGALKQTSALPVPQIEPANVAKSKASLVNMLEGIGQRMRTMEMALAGLGKPPVPNGDALYRTTMGRLTSTHSGVTTAKRRLEQAKVTDAKSLKGAMDQMKKAFGSYNGYQGPQADLRADPALNAAFAKAPACQTAKG